MAQHESGKSFAEIAKAEGVGTDELLAEATAIEKAELDAAVKAGKLTAAQRTEVLSGLQAQLKEELTEVHTATTAMGSATTATARRRLPRRAARSASGDGAVLLTIPGPAPAGPRDEGRRLREGGAASPASGQVKPAPAPPRASARRRGWRRW